MARRRRSSLALSAERAQQALAVLVHEGKLRAGEVMKALQRRDRLIKALKASLTALETGVGIVGKRLFADRVRRRPGRAQTMKPKATRRKPRISAATRAKYRLQGKYLSVLRPLSKAQRARVKAVRAKSGVQAAIAAARKIGKA
jgi:hypothetical protein